MRRQEDFLTMPCDSLSKAPLRHPVADYLF